MANRRSGWKGESRRHSLARKGIKTNLMPTEGIPKITIGKLEDMIRENNERYGTNFQIGSTYGYYELWAGDERIEVGSKKDIYNAFVKYRFSEKYRKNIPKAVLTNEEEKAWNFAFQYHLNEGKSDEQADELAWNDLQREFPRLKQFKGIASGKVADDINRIFKRTEEHGSRTAKRINRGLQKIDEDATETARDFNKAIKKVG